MKLAELKEYAKKLLVLALGAMSLACGNADVKACKNAKFDIDTTRTLEQAFKDNPIIVDVKWTSIEKDGKKFVQVDCVGKDDYIYEELKKNKEKFGDEIFVREVYRILIKINAADMAYLFSVPEKNGEIGLVKATFTMTKDRALSAAKSAAKKMAMIGVKSSIMEELQNGAINEIENKKDKYFEHIEQTKEYLLIDLLKEIYKKEFSLD